MKIYVNYIVCKFYFVVYKRLGCANLIKNGWIKNALGILLPIKWVMPEFFTFIFKFSCKQRSYLKEMKYKYLISSRLLPHRWNIKIPRERIKFMKFSLFIIEHPIKISLSAKSPKRPSKVNANNASITRFTHSNKPTKGKSTHLQSKSKSFMISQIT